MSVYKKFFPLILTLVLIGLAVFSVGRTAVAKADEVSAEAIPVQVLILPKFEITRMYGDFPGEAQYYYERYLEGAESYDIPGGTEGSRLYVKDGVAMYVLGMGKVTAALSTMAVLSDARFDFSDAYILSTG